MYLKNENNIDKKSTTEYVDDDDEEGDMHMKGS